MFDENTPFPVFCQECWWKDDWDPMQYGREYDFSRPFFQQFKDLQNQIPRVGVIQQGTNVNSPFINCASNNKDSYLIFASNFDENCNYCVIVSDSKDCIDCYGTNKSERCYNCINCFNCYNVRGSQDCLDCRDSYFLFNCRNCTDCIGCTNLSNAQYCIDNKPYPKDEYFKILKQLNFSSFASSQNYLTRFQNKKQSTLVKFMSGTHNAGVSGNWLYDCKNTLDAFICRNIEDSKHLFQIIEAKDSMDYYSFGKGCELVYDSMTIGYQCYDMQFCINCWYGNRQLRYCDMCHSSSNLFGCIGLRNKQYCILNKQYTKEQYEDLTARIVKHMGQMPYVDAKGRTYTFGELFPTELSLFSYNETIAQEYFPLSQKEVAEFGFRWREPKERSYESTISWEYLPDNISDVEESITQEVILCEAWSEDETKAIEHNCTKAFKITPNELAFYRSMGLPLPRRCSNSRHYERLKQRNPLKLWHRKCQCSGQKSESGVYQNTVAHQHGVGKCPNEFETSYSPEKKEIVYCEQCYNAEVV